MTDKPVSKERKALSIEVEIDTGRINAWALKLRVLKLDLFEQWEVLEILHRYMQNIVLFAEVQFRKPRKGRQYAFQQIFKGLCDPVVFRTTNENTLSLFIDRSESLLLFYL